MAIRNLAYYCLPDLNVNIWLQCKFDNFCLFVLMFLFAFALNSDVYSSKRENSKVSFQIWKLHFILLNIIQKYFTVDWCTCSYCMFTKLITIVAMTFSITCKQGCAFRPIHLKWIRFEELSSHPGIWTIPFAVCDIFLASWKILESHMVYY